MSTGEIKKKLISKIRDSDNEDLLLEVYHLMEMEDDDISVYPLNEEQISIVQESQAQIKSGKFLTRDDASKEIDEWLGK